ncbi:MAG: ABC transporter substrate-binding protein [Cellulosilyticaceae bacterium]
MKILKTIPALLLMTLVSTTFTGCGSAQKVPISSNDSNTTQTAAANTKDDAKSIRVFQLKVEIDSPLKEYAKLYEEQTGVHVDIESIGGGADSQGTLKGYLAANNMPDIFVFEGPGHFKVWKDYMADLSNEKWVAETSAAYTGDGGKVYGFPYAVEGYGLAYNKTLLDKAGIDPATLTTIDAYKAAFEKLDGMKKDLGINSVVSMGVSSSGGMTWVSGNHNFGVYLSTGLKNGDTSVIDNLLAGKVDKERLTQYAQYVKLLFDYSDPNILLTGNYDQSVQAFADQKAVFIHQGNWIDPSLPKEPGFEMGFAPHAFSHDVTDGIQVGAPSWWAVYKDGNVQAAKDFLTAFALSDSGRDARINKMSLISPYSSDTMKPSTPLSANLQSWVAAGKTYDWQQFKMPDGFGQDTLGPIFELLAQGSVTTDQFVQLVTDAIAEVPNK